MTDGKKLKVLVHICKPLCNCYFILLLFSSLLKLLSFPLTSIIAVRRRNQSRRRRSRTLLSHPASLRFTQTTTLWQRRLLPPPSPMALPFSLHRRWLENWHARRPSVHRARTMICLSTFSLLLNCSRSTTSRRDWGMVETVSATAASSSRIWTCQCLLTSQTIVSQTWRAQSPWGKCLHAAVASALTFSWEKVEAPGKVLASVSRCGNNWTGLESCWVSFYLPAPADWTTLMALRTVFLSQPYNVLVHELFLGPVLNT